VPVASHDARINLLIGHLRERYLWGPAVELTFTRFVGPHQVNRSLTRLAGARHSLPERKGEPQCAIRHTEL